MNLKNPLLVLETPIKQTILFVKKFIYGLPKKKQLMIQK